MVLNCACSNGKLPMSNLILSACCFLVTLGLYYVNKACYRRRRSLLLMPLILTPIILILLMTLTKTSYQNYFSDTHWLLWLLGPATIAFAVPVYENLAVIRRHWLSLSAGVVVALLMSVSSSVWLARLLALPEGIQRSLSVRSVTTPFAMEAAKRLGGQGDLVALFTVITGVFGMAIGDFLFLRLSINSSMAKGASLGAASHGAGTAKAYQIGAQEGVVSSLVMMMAGVITVILAPFIGQIMW